MSFFSMSWKIVNVRKYIRRKECKTKKIGQENFWWKFYPQFSFPIKNLVADEEKRKFTPIDLYSINFCIVADLFYTSKEQQSNRVKCSLT